MLELPLNLALFAKWFLWNAPKRLFRTAQIILILINNELSFTLNLKLMFTPLFGDYTFMGRFIGFCIRLVQILVGSILLAVLFVLSLFVPIIWWLIPIIIYTKLGFWVLVYIATLLFSWIVLERNTPQKRINQVKNNVLSSFRPSAKKYLSAPAEMFGNNQILYLLKKAELLNDKLINELAVSYPNKQEIIQKAFTLAQKQNTRYVELEHVFLAYLSLQQHTDRILSTYGCTQETLNQTAIWLMERREELGKVYFWQADFEKPIMGGIGKGMTGRITPFLNSMSTDFTKAVRKGEIKKIVGRQDEIKKIAEVLNSDKLNVLIIGEPGSGKTSIVKGMAYEIMKGTEFSSLKFKRIVNLDIGSLLSGTKSPGDVATKLTRVMQEVEASKDIILFIDEIHNLVASEDKERPEVANIFSILQPYLSGNRVQFIGATNIENYRKYIEPNGSFSRLFELIEIPQASKEDTLEILKSVAREDEAKYNITISLPALKKVIELSEKLIHERVLPDKAIDILNRTAASSSKEHRYLKANDIALEIAQITHIPVANITEDESKKLLAIESELKKRVIGQDDALKQISSALKRARAGMRNEKKPISSFLFVGTTGVGKTETAKALAQTYFGDPKSIIRLDMSEYQQADSINRLLGSPDGNSKGILTEAVRTRPFSLILLDEIEKAYSNILLTFLQVLDDGRLTDSTGTVVDFTNSIIIATSNVGTRVIQEISARNGTFEEMQDATLKEVRAHFAPEFLNRFSGIIVYRPLDMDSVRKVCLLMLTNVKKMAENKGVQLSFKPDLVEELIKRGFSPEWGARPLARTIEDSVESYLAEKFLANEIKSGDIVELGTEVFGSN